MTNVITMLAAGGENLPLEGQINPLFPKNYDLFWSTLSLIVILFIFWKWVIPKFQEVLAERTERIEGGMEKAEAAQAEAKAALEKYNAQLSEARQEAADIREQARERGKEIEAEIRAQAQQESARIVEAGERQLSASRQQVIRELRAEMGRNSIDLAEQLLGGELSDDTRRSRTIDEFLAGLDTVSASKPAGK